MKWRIVVAVIVLALLFGPCEGPIMESLVEAQTIEEDVGPPEGAIQILPNGGFEEVGSWQFVDDAYVTQAIAYEGMNSLHLGGADAWGYAFNSFDLSKCDLMGGSIWVRAAWATVAQPPLVSPGDAVTEGWLANYQHVSFATLWTRYDHEALNMGWQDPWTRVDGLDEILWTDPLVYLYIGGLTGEQSVEFFYDNVEVWCVPAYVVPWMVFLPIVMNGG